MDATQLASLGDSVNVLVIGASGGVGQALAQQLSLQPTVKQVYALSRKAIGYHHEKVSYGDIDLNDEESIANAADRIRQALGQERLSLVIVASGILHQGEHIQPEKCLNDLSQEKLLHLLSINTVGPALVAKYFIPLMPSKGKSVFAALSARVGSITDNHLGGWYAYRCSKAALNMILKTAAIEVGRRYKDMVVVGLHPGTVDTQLSKPFQQRVPEGKLFTPEFSASALLKVIEQLSAEDSGQIFAWDGQAIPY